MRLVQTEIDRVLTLLRNKIRERGFTQLEVQEALSWGRSYISQLLTKQKSTRYEQILLILDVIGVEPRDFFADLFQHLPARRPWSEPGTAVSGRLDAFIRLLIEKGVLTAEEAAHLLAE